jgi:hypothetical protein
MRIGESLSDLKTEKERNQFFEWHNDLKAFSFEHMAALRT